MNTNDTAVRRSIQDIVRDLYDNNLERAKLTQQGDALREELLPLLTTQPVAVIHHGPHADGKYDTRVVLVSRNESADPACLNLSTVKVPE